MLHLELFLMSCFRTWASLPILVGFSLIHSANAEQRPSSQLGAVTGVVAKVPASTAEATNNSSDFEINKPTFQINKPQPRCDAGCVQANSDRAARACARRIEAEAPIDFEWVMRPFGNIFQQGDLAATGSSIVLYRGDAIRFLNPQKEWIRVSYQCAFDVEQGDAKEVRIRPGRLNAPPPVGADSQKQQPTTRAPSPGTLPVSMPARQGGPGQAQTQPSQMVVSAQPKIDSATLAAAIRQAAEKRQAARMPKIGEDSQIEFTQMPANRGHF